MLAIDSRLAQLGTESGLTAIIKSSRDAKILCLQRFVRLFAYGESYLILVQFLSSLDIADGEIGLFMTLTLLGDVVISLILTLITDQIGRRNVLVAGAALMAMSGLVFSFSSNYWFLVLASVAGVISPSGNEIGPFRAVEESILAQLTVKEERSHVFAWYTLFGTLGAALGTLTCGLVVQALQEIESWSITMVHRVIFASYSILGLAKLVLSLMLSPAVEHSPEPIYHAVDLGLEEDSLLSENSEDEGQRPNPSSKRRTSDANLARRTTLDCIRSLLPHISPLSRAILVRLIVLFALDSFASGLASPSWLTYFFATVHALRASTLGALFLVTNVLATVSNLLALPLARRIGPLKTMVFTHFPSAILLGLIPVPSSTASGTWISMTLLSLRACTQSMDQAPRQSFLAAAVLPAERTAVLGVVNVTKTLAQAGGIGSAGVLAGAKLWMVIFGGAGALKAAYDILMLWMFLGLKDREEHPGREGSLGEVDRRIPNTHC